MGRLGLGRKSDFVRIDRRSFLIALMPLLVFVGGFYFYAAFGWQDCYRFEAGDSCTHPDEFNKFLAERVLPAANAANPPENEAASRAHAMTSVMLCVAVAIFILLLFVIETVRLFSAVAVLRLMALAAAIILTIVTVFFFLEMMTTWRLFHVSAFDWAGHQRLLDIAWGPHPIHEGSDTSLYHLAKWMVGIVSVSMPLALSALIVGTVSCLARPARNLPHGLRTRLAALQRQRLDRFLLLSAILLTVGLAYQIAMLQWPAFAIPDEAGRKIYQAFVEAIVFYFGVNYTILIASYYFPVAMILSSATRRASPAESGTSESSEKARSNWSSVGSAFALLSPALASLVPTVVDMFGQV